MLGFQRAFHGISPAIVKGIELNPDAAELAGVSVWIGEIQWMLRTDFATRSTCDSSPAAPATADVWRYVHEGVARFPR